MHIPLSLTYGLDSQMYSFGWGCGAFAFTACLLTNVKTLTAAESKILTFLATR